MAADDLRLRVAAYAKAISARDIEAVMSFFAPDVVSYDLEAPLRYAGADKKRERWQRDFAHFTRIDYEVRDLDITVNGTLAVASAINRLNGTLPDGKTTGSWVRWTACWRMLGGEWRIVHDHVSVPVDLRQGKAILDLTP